MKTCTLFAAALAFGLVQSAALDFGSEEGSSSMQEKRDEGGNLGEWHEYADTPIGKVYSNVARDLHNSKRDEATTWHEYADTPVGKVYSNVARDLSAVKDDDSDESIEESSTSDSLSARDSNDDAIYNDFIKNHPEIGNDPQSIQKYINTHPDLKKALEAAKPHKKRDLIAESAALEKRDYSLCIACMSICILAHTATAPAGGPVWLDILFACKAHCLATRACGRNQAGRYVNDHMSGTRALSE